MNQTWVELDKKIERTLLAVVTCSVLLIAIPNLSLSLLQLHIGLEKNVPDWMIVIRRYVSSFMILNSGLNFWLYLAFHSTFRAKAGIHILGKRATVAPSKNIQVLPMVVQKG
ncbi:MAG: hypothetical protein GY696_22300 [Gammaproteobacteria bacterium]|nr:hypothetical protein [Gammaproteobacteria bacterium]